MLKSLCIAFATYSRIPTPRVEWTADALRYAICFFPLIGAVIGALEYGWLLLSELLCCGDLLRGKALFYSHLRDQGFVEPQYQPEKVVMVEC